MPELPEVECLTRAVRKLVENGTLTRAEFFRKDLREPIPIRKFKLILESSRIEEVSRRAKYMLWKTKNGWGLFHLGMSGNMFSLESAKPERKHTHAVFTIECGNGTFHYLHFVDPRRFGRISCVEHLDLSVHPYIENLGVEPLSQKNLAKHLFVKSRNKNLTLKSFLMDNRIVVGVGNIYACEAMFKSQLNPVMFARDLTNDQTSRLAKQIKATLKAAIRSGGTTFRDYANTDGKPGYFQVELQVYGKENLACPQCKNPIAKQKIAGRSTFYCPKCQK